MAVDRGGLNYTISVKDQFSAATAKFVTEITKARQAFAEFKAESQGLAATNTRIAVTIDRATQASSRKTSQLSAEAEAERKLTRILRERIVGEELRELAQRKGVQLSAQKTRQLTVEQEAERKLLAAARAAAVARRVEEQALKRGIDLSRRKVRQLTVEEEAQQKVAAALRRRQVLAKTEELAYAAGIELSKKKTKQLTVEEEALRRVEKAERERAVAARVSAIEQQKFIGPPVPPNFVPPTTKPTAPADTQTLSGLAKARSLLDQFRTSLGQTNQGGNDLLFTFRRLFGVLAAFQAARAIFTGFIEFIKAGIQFNATIEDTRLGIASVIVATGELATAQGKVTNSGEAFLLAQQEALRQQRLLRAEALKTTATFSQLLETFQTALGPGIAAGLKPDQIREFSVRISQAASAINLSQNQLAEEIRSILSGTIQARTTRIATTLGITNEDIRRAREAGTLFEFLQERFQSFGIAGEAASKTFTGLTQILKGALEELAGLAAQPLFEDLKAVLQEMVDLLLTIGPDGAVIINPDAIEAIAPIFLGIQSALASIRDTAGQIGFGDLQSSAKVIGVAIAAAGEIIAGVVKGLVDGFQVVISIIQAVAKSFGGQTKSLSEIVALVTKYSVIFGSVLVIVGLVGTALNALLSPLRLAISLVTTLATGALNVLNAFLKLPVAIQAAFGRLVLVVGIFLAIAEAVRQITEGIFGVNLSLKQTIELITLGFLGGIFDAISAIEELAFKIKNSISEAFTTAAEAAINFVNEARLLIASFTGDDKEAQAIAAEQLETEKAQDRERFIRRKKFELELADLRRQNEAKSLAFTDEIAKVVGEAAGQDALGQIPSTIEELLGGLTSLFGGFDLGLSSFFKDLQDGKGLDLNGFFNLDEFLAKIKKAQEDAAAGGGAGLTITPRGLPVTDEQRRELAEAQQKLALTQQQVAAQRALNDLNRQNASQDAVRLQELRNQLIELQTQLDTQRVLNELEVQKAAQAIGGAQGEEQRLFLEEQLAVLKAQQIADEEELKAKIDETNLALERQRLIVEGTINDGFGQGLADFANQFSSAFQAGINIAGGLLQSFTSFVSDSIVSAFDPNNDTSIKERFGRFLGDLAKLILSELIKLQIAKLLLGFGFGGGAPAGAAEGGSIGMAHGGSIPRRGAASAAHYGVGVRGLVGGGQATPPPGIDRRDTVPIWAQPGEFMQSLAAVRTYGRDFMEALNRRVIDPRSLRGLAGLRTTKRLASAAHRGPGFATGGLISEQIAKQTAAQSLVAAQPSGGGGVQRAVVVAGEAEFDKLVSGGSNSLIRWMRDNRDTVRGILDRG